MKDKKELLEQTIKEDLEKEAQEILKALETSDADKLSDEKQLELKKKIDKKIEDYEFEKICNELPEEYRDALRAGMELKNRKTVPILIMNRMKKNQTETRKSYERGKACACMWR